MFAQLKYTLRFFIYYFLLLIVGRAMFYVALYTSFQKEGVPFKEVLSILWHAFPLDLSAFAYLYTPIFLILSASAIFTSRIWKWILHWYVMAIAVAGILIFVCEMAIYEDWNSKLSYKALLYLKNPKEVLQTATTYELMVGVLFVIGLILAFYFVYKKFLYINFTKAVKKWALFLYILITPLLWLVAARGGFTGLPISQSDAFFSSKQIVNDLSVNPIWNLAHNVVYSKDLFSENPYQYFDNETACKICNSLFVSQSDTSVALLTTSRPNIVLVILESWSADAIQSLSPHTYNFTPHFAELEKGGVLFTEVYGSGKRTQQGMASIISGFPAIPGTFITNYPEKSRKLPAISSTLKKEGYHTSFYYGGELTFGNLGAFLYSKNFDKVVDQNDISGDFEKLKLGYHDEVMLPYWIEVLREEETPFFTSLLTVSSHRPYEQPKPPTIIDDKLHRANYLNSVCYVDSCLGDFMRRAQQEAWYDSTLFVFISDHGHPSHLKQPFFNFHTSRIPLLLYGEVIAPNYKGIKINALMNQHDLAALLLDQLQLPYTDFKWSKNPLVDSTYSFAYQDIYAGEGFGFRTHDGELYYYNGKVQNHNFLLPKDTVAYYETLRKGKAYLQMLFQEVVDL